MSVTLLDNTSTYSDNSGGEFRAVGNSSLDAVVDWAAYSSQTSGTISKTTDGSTWGYNSGLNGSSYFQTFCIEYNEAFTPGSVYNVGISKTLNSDGTGAPVTLGVAWLYSQFAAGTLNTYSGYGTTYNYAYSSGRSNSAGLMQEAIWWLQGEAGGVRTSFINEVEQALYGAGHDGGIYDADIKAAANGAYDVYGLDLIGGQDQLVIEAPSNNSAVLPEPSTVLAGALLLLPLGASAFRILRRTQS